MAPSNRRWKYFGHGIFSMEERIYTQQAVQQTNQSFAFAKAPSKLTTVWKPVYRLVMTDSNIAVYICCKRGYKMSKFHRRINNNRKNFISVHLRPLQFSGNHTSFIIFPSSWLTSSSLIPNFLNHFTVFFLSSSHKVLYVSKFPLVSFCQVCESTSGIARQ